MQANNTPHTSTFPAPGYASQITDPGSSTTLPMRCNLRSGSNTDLTMTPSPEPTPTTSGDAPRSSLETPMDPQDYLADLITSEAIASLPEEFLEIPPYNATEEPLEWRATIEKIEKEVQAEMEAETAAAAVQEAIAAEAPMADSATTTDNATFEEFTNLLENLNNHQLGGIATIEQIEMEVQAEMQTESAAATILGVMREVIVEEPPMADSAAIADNPTFEEFTNLLENLTGHQSMEMAAPEGVEAEAAAAATAILFALQEPIAEEEPVESGSGIQKPVYPRPSPVFLNIMQKFIRTIDYRGYALPPLLTQETLTRLFFEIQPIIHNPLFFMARQVKRESNASTVQLRRENSIYMPVEIEKHQLAVTLYALLQYPAALRGENLKPIPIKTVMYLCDMSQNMHEGHNLFFTYMANRALYHRAFLAVKVDFEKIAAYTYQILDKTQTPNTAKMYEKLPGMYQAIADSEKFIRLKNIRDHYPNTPLSDHNILLLGLPLIRHSEEPKKRSAEASASESMASASKQKIHTSVLLDATRAHDQTQTQDQDRMTLSEQHYRDWVGKVVKKCHKKIGVDEQRNIGIPRKTLLFWPKPMQTINSVTNALSDTEALNQINPALTSIKTIIKENPLEQQLSQLEPHIATIAQASSKKNTQSSSGRHQLQKINTATRDVRTILMKGQREIKDIQKMQDRPLKRPILSKSACTETITPESWRHTVNSEAKQKRAAADLPWTIAATIGFTHNAQVFSDKHQSSNAAVEAQKISESHAHAERKISAQQASFTTNDNMLAGLMQLSVTSTHRPAMGAQQQASYVRQGIEAGREKEYINSEKELNKLFVKSHQAINTAIAVTATLPTDEDVTAAWRPHRAQARQSERTRSTISDRIAFPDVPTDDPGAGPSTSRAKKTALPAD